MRVLFARHGESEANRQRVISNRDLPHPLTPRGVAQSLALARTLIGREVGQVIASPIPRAWQTAALVADALGVPCSTSPALREFDCGAMEGRGDDEAWAEHAALVRAWDEEHDEQRRIPPDGESFADLRARFLPFVASLVAGPVAGRDSRAGDVLLVSHGGLLHHLLPLVLGNVGREFTDGHPLGHCALIVARVHSGRLVCTEWAGSPLA